MNKGYYCSNALQEEVNIQVKEIWAMQYSSSLFFLKEWLEKWQNENSVDGTINQAPRIAESADKKLMVDVRFKDIQISINGIPRIRENRWVNLIEKANMCLTFPNHYLKIDSQIVKELIQIVNVPEVGIIYKALITNFQPMFFEESIYPTLQTGATVPLQKDLQQVFFENNYIFMQAQMELKLNDISNKLTL